MLPLPEPFRARRTGFRLDGYCSVNSGGMVPSLISTKSIFGSEESGKPISLFVEGVREFYENPFSPGLD